MPDGARPHGELLPRLRAKGRADVFRHLLAKSCDASPGVRRRVTVEPQVSEPVEPQLSLRPFTAALIITKCRDPHAAKIDFSQDLCGSEQEHALHLGSTARERKAAYRKSTRLNSSSYFASRKP